MEMTKPHHLKPGDIVAALTISSGLPHMFPHVFEQGLQTLRDLGLIVKEYPTTRESNLYLQEHPEERARDMNAAFADPEVKAMFASIGGKDSVRMIPFLDANTIQKNPKVFVGFSDATSLHVYFNSLGLVTMHGPTVMAGLAQVAAYPEQKQHILDMLFVANSSYTYAAFTRYSEGYPDWSTSSETIVNEQKTATNWNWLLGAQPVRGQLAGGCLQVLDRMITSDQWPKSDFWKNAVVILETSENVPTIPEAIEMMRRLGAADVFSEAAGILFGRMRGYTEAEKIDFDTALTVLIRNEFKRNDLCLVTNVDFGHTDPQLLLPLGVTAQIDPVAKCISLTDSWLV